MIVRLVFDDYDSSDGALFYSTNFFLLFFGFFSFPFVLVMQNGI